MVSGTEALKDGSFLDELTKVEQSTTQIEKIANDILGILEIDYKEKDSEAEVPSSPTPTSIAFDGFTTRLRGIKVRLNIAHLDKLEKIYAAIKELGL